MPDSQSHSYDVFVSYAHVDNEPIHPAQQGWVDALIGILSVDLGMKLGRREAFEIWFDGQNLRGNHEVNGHIPEQVRRSALFLAILSPGYAASTFCLQELQTFVDSGGRDDLERLFVVCKSPLDEERHQAPEVFRTLRKYQFSRPDEHRKPRTLGWPEPRSDLPADRQYFQLIDDLACDIEQKLAQLRRSPIRPSASSRLMSPAGDRRPAVLLAEVTDDLEARRDEIRRYLAQEGIEVLPAGAYRLVREHFEHALPNDLASCAAFIQLLGPVAGKHPPDVPEGFNALQYDLAQRVATARPDLAILQWRSADLDMAKIESPRQRLLLQLETVQAVPFEEFKQTIVRKVRSGAEKILPRAAFVFINAADVDLDSAQAVRDHLGDNIAWAMPLCDPEAKAEEVQEYIESNLKNCDGLVLIYGKAKPRWVTSQLQLYQKLAKERDKELRVLAVVEAPPEPKIPIPIGLPGLKTVRIADVPNVIRPVLMA